MSSKRIIPRYRILSALGIIFVVAGHIDFGVFDVAGVFPYYSFHIGIFTFISGYFYREEEEQRMGSYWKRKIFHLLLPYYGWNLFYGLLAAFLRSQGFTIGSPLGIKSLLLDPFLGGHQFGLNFSAWFVPVLFLLEMINIIGRKILNLVKINYEILIFTLSLLAGMITVMLAERGSVWGYYKHVGCLLFLFPIFQFGIFYRKILEEKINRMPMGIYFTIIISVQYLVLWYSKGQVAYSAVWCSGFLHGPLVPYLTTFLGIGFWLGISRLLVPLWKEGNFLDLIGKNTFSIMMHHVPGFFFLNLVYFMLNQWDILTGFEIEKFFSSYEYKYLVLGMENSKWFYLLAGIGFSLAVSWMIKRLRIFLLASR